MTDRWWPDGAPYPRQKMFMLVDYELKACIEYADSQLRENMEPGKRDQYIEWFRCLYDERAQRAQMRKDDAERCKAEAEQEGIRP